MYAHLDLAKDAVILIPWEERRMDMWEGMVDGWWSMHDGCELANSTTRACDGWVSMMYPYDKARKTRVRLNSYTLFNLQRLDQ